jgi:hypothetical protein
VASRSLQDRGISWTGKVRPGLAGWGRARRGRVGYGVAFGMDRTNWDWPGKDWPGKDRPGAVRRGMARLGWVRFGIVGHGMAWCGLISWTAGIGILSWNTPSFYTLLAVLLVLLGELMMALSE